MSSSLTVTRCMHCLLVALSIIMPSCSEGSTHGDNARDDQPVPENAMNGSDSRKYIVPMRFTGGPISNSGVSIIVEDRDHIVLNVNILRKSMNTDYLYYSPEHLRSIAEGNGINEDAILTTGVDVQCDVPDEYQWICDCFQVDDLVRPDDRVRPNIIIKDIDQWRQTGPLGMCFLWHPAIAEGGGFIWFTSGSGLHISNPVFFDSVSQLQRDVVPNNNQLDRLYRTAEWQ